MVRPELWQSLRQGQGVPMKNSPLVHVQRARPLRLEQRVQILRTHVWGLLVCLGVWGVAHAADVQTMSAVRLASEITTHEAPVILDVRSVDEFAAGHVPGAINVAHSELDDHAEQLSAYKDRDIVVYCVSGKRAAKALQWLSTHGFDHLWHLEGDYSEWVKAGREIELTEPTMPR
jgi:rhodanese-related sulfurtransferase